ncbi:MAG TPA: oligosaccharyl transferase, archaeosortase A system-associated, partial [Dehalococcoidia bacterium]|nr:oligosaccharyl transferase, archaeosortase A system-associated [Dehalococcoidia bacterium]
MAEQSPERKRRLPPVAIVGIIMAVLCGVAAYIRIALPHNQVFVNGQVLFTETDAYYYMRQVESIVRHFPHFNTFDPYQLYPGGAGGLLRPFFAWLISAAILLIRGASSSLNSMETVAAYVPPILGVLTLIPVYFIGKELFNRWVGVISAALMAIVPSEFLHRSMLSFTDHDVAENLFSIVCMLFLIMAIKRAREREISFSHILSRDWSTVRKPLVYTLLAGIFLGIYLLTWIGGLIFYFIIFTYLLIQFIVDHLRHKSTDYLCIIATPVFFIAFLMVLPVLTNTSMDNIYRVSMVFAILAPIALSIVSRLMSGRAWKPVYYPLVLVGLAGIGLAAFHATDPSFLHSMLSQFSIFTPSGAALTIMEAAPLAIQLALANFGPSFFIAFVSIAMLIYVAIKGKSADKILFLVWSAVMLVAAFGQRRFCNEYTVNVALLTGYFSWKMLDIAGLNKLLTKPKEIVESVKKFKKKKKKTRKNTGEKAKPRTFMQPRGVWARVIVVGIVLFAVVFLPIIPGAIALGESPNYVMDEGWYSSCLWLKDNTPDPFGDPNFYYALYPPQDEFKYPETAYGVMSWWDYGHFIMQIGHRIPNANPGQAGAVQAGQFFTALNESAANAVADKEGTKYVMIDYMMATSKFYAMAEWAGENEGEFYNVYYVPTSSSALQPVTLYYRTYYETTVARLYDFDGQAVVPSTNSTIAVSWNWITGSQLISEG